MSGALLLYDHPDDAPRFMPFSQSRPIGELRYGAWLLRERAEQALGLAVTGHVAAAHLARFSEPGAPPVMSDAGARGLRLVLRSTFVPDRAQPDVSRLTADTPLHLADASGASIGFVLPDGIALPAGQPTGWQTLTLQGRRLIGAWQIIGDLGAVLRGDLEAALRGGAAGAPAGVTVLGDAALVLADPTAVIEPFVVCDTRGGPIWLRAGAEVRSGSRLAGPLVVGEGTRVVGGQLRESSIGPRCVVHGELSNSVFVGYANKSHDGFVGHSLIGRWANLGAGTITSNLKNTYGSIRLNLGAERVETGMMFLGSLIGDHVKTAIGTMLPTGCLLGTGANVFGTRRPESHVAAFAWGTDEPGRRLACRMFLQTASRVLPRRDVAFDDATAAFLTDIWQHATGQSCD